MATRSTPRRSLRVAVIGAGVSGIAMAVKLEKAGFRDFTVFERSSGPGGTWWDNKYPGCEVDVASHAYSFTFMPYDWSRNYARRDEVQCYLADVVERMGVAARIRYNTAVQEAIWDEDARVYRVHLADGSVEAFDAVVSCLGLLNNPKYPDWPGLDEFEGSKFHTSRWDTDLDLTGKTVAVVGTGSTACQLVPAIAPIAGHVYLFQRSPGWVFAKDDRPYTPRERSRYRRFSILQRVSRLRRFSQLDSGKRRRLRIVESDVQAEWRAKAISYIESEIQDPELRRAVTPNYPVGCKRLVLANGYYQALNRDDVDLVPHEVVGVTRDGIVGADGIERKIDVLVMSTGFTAQRYLASLEVKGVGGRSIHDVWRESARAFFGITVPGMPNFFMLYGPNTNGGVSIMATAEHQAKAVVATLRRMSRTDSSVVETRGWAAERFIRWIDAENAKLSATSPRLCNNYNFAQDGRNVTQWPQTFRLYVLMLRTLYQLGLRISSTP